MGVVADSCGTAVRLENLKENSADVSVCCGGCYRHESDAGPLLRRQDGHLLFVRGSAAHGFRVVPDSGPRSGHEHQFSGRHARARLHSSNRLSGKP